MRRIESSGIMGRKNGEVRNKKNEDENINKQEAEKEKKKHKILRKRKE